MTSTTISNGVKAVKNQFRIWNVDFDGHGCAEPKGGVSMASKVPGQKGWIIPLLEMDGLDLEFSGRFMIHEDTLGLQGHDCIWASWAHYGLHRQGAGDKTYFNWGTDGCSTHSKYPGKRLFPDKTIIEIPDDEVIEID